jgi:hypothetical protein
MTNLKSFFIMKAYLFIDSQIFSDIIMANLINNEANSRRCTFVPLFFRQCHAMRRINQAQLVSQALLGYRRQRDAFLSIFYCQFLLNGAFSSWGNFI